MQIHVRNGVPEWRLNKSERKQLRSARALCDTINGLAFRDEVIRESAREAADGIVRLLVAFWGPEEDDDVAHGVESTIQV